MVSADKQVTPRARSKCSLQGHLLGAAGSTIGGSGPAATPGDRRPSECRLPTASSSSMSSTALSAGCTCRPPTVLLHITLQQSVVAVQAILNPRMQRHCG